MGYQASSFNCKPARCGLLICCFPAPLPAMSQPLAWSTMCTTEGPQASRSPCRMFVLLPMPRSCLAGRRSGAVCKQRVREQALMPALLPASQPAASAAPCRCQLHGFASLQSPGSPRWGPVP